MYLILTTGKAEKRNKAEAKKLGWEVPGAKVWGESFSDKGNHCALDVKSGEGLTDSELEKCVKELPNDFIIESVL